MTDKPKRNQSKDRIALKAAAKLLASSERGAAINEWLERRAAMREARGGELVLPDHSADVAMIQARLRARALTILEDIAVYSPNEKHQLRAIELTLQVPLMQQTAAALPAAVHAQVVGETTVPVVDVPEDKVERVHELLVMRRKLANGGGP